ncbi:hypothetical protein LCGC14_2202130 [marine sediment metagenome]|uniref:Uncharacterized protein n=1 Tax=marine sediment metagenome TaxID=412755 RepID=A0A0F9E3R1_9ZZZZ
MFGPQVLDIIEKGKDAALLKEQNISAQIAERERIRTQITSAQQRGDLAEVGRLREQWAKINEEILATGAAANGNGTPGPLEFVQKNWGWILVGVGAIVVGPSLVSAISDR